LNATSYKFRFGGKGIRIMESLKQEAISAIAKLPDSADIDEIMYRLYLIDKVRKGEDAIKSGEYTAIEDLRKEIESWGSVLI
jgi:hypothetical protein